MPDLVKTLVPAQVPVELECGKQLWKFPLFLKKLPPQRKMC